MDFTVYIPNNFTDAGRLFGVFELRNALECAALCIPLALLTLLLPLPGFTLRVMLCAALVIPAGGFALIGIHDDSLFTFLLLYCHWRRNRRILTYRGLQWENAKKKQR